MAEDEMKLWLLKPVAGLPEEISPWVRWDEMTVGLVVRASSERDARELASSAVCHEFDTQTPWLDSMLSTCVELNGAGAPGVILADRRMCN